MRLHLSVLCLLVLPLMAAAPSPDHAGTAMQAGNTDAERAMMSGMARMNEAMSAAPMTGNPDSDFVAMMTPHHQGAIDMARTELQYGKDPAIRRLAREIVAAQEKEITLMKRWQASHH